MDIAALDRSLRNYTGLFLCLIFYTIYQRLFGTHLWDLLLLTTGIVGASTLSIVKRIFDQAKRQTSLGNLNFTFNTVVTKYMVIMLTGLTGALMLLVVYHKGILPLIDDFQDFHFGKFTWHLLRTIFILAFIPDHLKIMKLVKNG